MFCLAVCKFSVHGLILSIMFDLSHCRISYSFSHIQCSFLRFLWQAPLKVFMFTFDVC